MTGAVEASPLVAPQTLPPPSQLQKLVSYTDLDRIRDGAEYDPALPNQDVMPSSSKLVFMPYFDPEGGRPNNGLAYACFSYLLPGYAHSPTVTYSWDMWPVDYSRFTLGLANWQKDRWDWWPCDATQQITLAEIGQYFDAEGRFIAIMVAYDPQANVAGEAIGALEYIRLGPAVVNWNKTVFDGAAQVEELDIDNASTYLVTVLYSDITPGAECIRFALFPFGDYSVVETGFADCLSVDGANAPSVLYDHRELGVRYGLGHLVDHPDVHFEFDLETAYAPDASGCSIQFDTVPPYLYEVYTCYFTGPSSTLCFATKTADGWDEFLVPGAVGVGGQTSIAEDAEGFPCASYCNSSLTSLKYARRVYPDWVLETVDSAAGIGAHSRLVMNAEFVPYIAYSDAANNGIKLAHKAGALWDTTAVADPVRLGPVSGIAIDALGSPHLSYADLESGALKHAVHNGTEWYIEVIDQAEGHQYGLANDIAIAPGGEITIIYSGYAEGNESALLSAKLIP